MVVAMNYAVGVIPDVMYTILDSYYVHHAYESPNAALTREVLAVSRRAHRCQARPSAVISCQKGFWLKE